MIQSLFKYLPLKRRTRNIAHDMVRVFCVGKLPYPVDFILSQRKNCCIQVVVLAAGQQLRPAVDGRGHRTIFFDDILEAELRGSGR